MAPIVAKQKSIVDSNFETVINEFSDKKKEAYDQLTANKVIQWFRPPLGAWSGGLQTEEDLKAIHTAFQTDEAEEALIDTLKPGEPGVNGDLITLPLQIDYMAQAERAFRSRHTQTFPRAIAHIAARSKGHGNDTTGVFKGQVLGYIKNIMKKSAK
jgi:hypothetical protein